MKDLLSVGKDTGASRDNAGCYTAWQRSQGDIRMLLELHKKEPGSLAFQLPDEQAVIAQVECCPDPTCDCHTLEFTVSPARGDREEVLYGFYLDLVNHRQDGSLSSTPDTRSFCQQLIQHLEEEDWHLLDAMYTLLKVSSTLHTDPEDVDAEFPMIEAIETLGKMVAYQNILPYSPPVLLDVDDPRGPSQAVRVMDYYCVREECDCRETLLRLVLIENNKLTDYQLDARFDLDTGQYRILEGEEDESGTLDPDRIMATLQQQPEIIELFCERYDQMREWYSLYRLEEACVEWLEDSLSFTPIPAMPPLTVEKIGRNDPCPCGSGKKYKKCCLH